MTHPAASPPDHRFWTVDEANAYLPSLDRLFDSVAVAAGPHAEEVRTTGVSPALVIEGVFAVLQEDGVIVRDLRRRLVDLRTRAGDGSVVLLCRVADEDRVAWWHGLRDGYVGRRSIDQDPPW